jgi:hypothetical protein
MHENAAKKKQQNLSVTFVVNHHHTNSSYIGKGPNKMRTLFIPASFAFRLHVTFTIEIDV